MIINNDDEGHVLTHLGLGDQITCNGLVRELYKRHAKLYVYCKVKYFYTIEFMYRDLPNLTVLPLEENGAQHFTDLHRIKNFYKLSIGSDETVEKSFYRQANVDFNKKFESFFIQRDEQREQALYSKFNFNSNNYAFIHDDAERGQCVDNNKITDKNLSIFRVNPSYTNNAFDYCKIIENASEIHTIESSFMFLIDLLFKDKNKKLYQHRCAKPIAPFEYPTNQSAWHLYE
jgi:hypothetical protein